MTKPNKDRYKKYFFLFLLWGTLGFFFVIQQYIYSASNDNAFNWFNNLSYRMPTYLLWALFTPLIYVIVSRIEFKRKAIVKNIITLVITGIIVSFLHRFMAIFLTFFIRDLYGTLQVSLSEALINARFAVFGGSFDSLFTYVLVLSVVVGIIYYNRLRQTELVASQLQTKLAEAKLDSLKSQLHPHFLFNTLHAVSTLMHRDVDLAEKTLTRLSDLLRLSLDNLDKQKIKLKDEADFLEKYLEIQQTRFQDKLVVDINIEPSLFDCLIPSFILQPVVENSIKYVVEPSSEKEKICVSASKSNDKLILSVSDTGPGISDKFEEGIGISNTRSRLRQIYGDNYEFVFENKNESGLKVTIKIPVES